MKIISKYLKLLPVFLLVFGLTACSDDDDNTVPTTTTVVDVAVENGFNALAAALTSANLVTTLQGTGPFTVFAPTDQAFQDLLDSNPVWNDLGDIDSDLLSTVLLNHVIIGTEVPSSAITEAGIYANVGATGPNDNNLSIYARLNGTTVEINGGDGTTAAPRNGADVTTANVEADNGIIHAINKVLLPPTIADMAVANPALETLVAALAFADTGSPTVPWIATVSNADAGPFTVFAPLNDAFTGPEGVLAELDLTGFGEGTGELNAATTDAVLTFHVVNGSNVQSTGLGALNGVIPTIGGNLDLNGTTITDANDRDSEILASLGLVDIQTANGVVHVIDKVILTPPQ